MTEEHSETTGLKVVSVGRDGKRRYDRQTKQKLVEACLEPGASVAGLAEMGKGRDDVRDGHTLRIIRCRSDHRFERYVGGMDQVERALRKRIQRAPQTRQPGRQIR